MPSAKPPLMNILFPKRTGEMELTFQTTISIGECISSGRHFDVYKARDRKTKRSLVFKIAKSGLTATDRAVADAHIELWRNEATLGVLGIPEIVAIGLRDERPFLVAQWIALTSLRQILADSNNLIDHQPCRPTAERFLYSTLEGALRILTNLHELNFVHRDINPGNILVDESANSVFLIDAAPSLNLTDPADPSHRLILGNPRYMSPEVLAGEPMSENSDLYALGRVIEDAAMLLQSPVPEVVHALTAFDRADRPSSAREALERLASPVVFVDAPRRGCEGVAGHEASWADARTRQMRVPASTTVVVGVPAPPSPTSTWSKVSCVLSVPISARARDLPAARADFSVFAPSIVEPGRSFILELWTAASTDHDLMIEQATRSNRMVERGDRSFVDIDRDIIITAILRLPDFEVADSIETLGWDGGIRNIGFIVKAPEMLRPGLYPGMMRLLRQQVPFANIAFDIEVGAELAKAIAPQSRIDAHVQRIERAFASYASQDRPEVLRRVQGIEAAGVRVFVDIMRLAAGQAWEPTIYREIDSSDGLFLFWSRSAAQSGWVEREWRYALEKRGLEFINPVPLEDPRFAPPPPALQSKHFNDMILASIRLEEQIHRDVTVKEPP